MAERRHVASELGHVVSGPPDNARIYEGELAFNYYDRKLGKIQPGSIDPHTGWFQFDHEDGGVAILNWDRVCSVAYARRMGWTE